MPNPQSFRSRKTRMLALPVTATTLLLGVVVLFLLAVPPRPAEALLPGTRSLAPTVTVSKSSVVVNEGQPATNSGAFSDEFDTDYDSVRVSASVGSITQSGTREEGTWSWSYATPKVSDDQTTQVKITAKDSTGRYTSKLFSLTVKDGPPANDSFSGAFEMPLPYNLYSGDTTKATMEVGEPRPYSPTKDCGNTGVSNSVWFKFTLPSEYTASPEGLYIVTYGSSFDTVLALYKGSSLGALEQVECSNNNSLPNWTDSLRVGADKLSAGQTYYLQLTGTGGARSGRYCLTYILDGPAPLGC